MLPEHTAVRITDEHSPYEGEVAFVHRVPGEEKEDGTRIPEGFYQVFLKPWENGFRTMTFSEENLEVCGC